MDEAARRIMEMKIEEAIAWHEKRITTLLARFDGDFRVGSPGMTELDIADRELYRMIRTATGVE